MKKLTTLLMLLCIVFSAQSAVLFNETFESYSDGTTIEHNQDASTPITMGVWNMSRKSDEGGGSSPKVTTRATAMKYPGYIHSGIKKVAVLDPTVNKRVSAFYADTITVARPPFTRYFAFLANFPLPTHSNAREIFIIECSTGSSASRGRVFVQKNGTSGTNLKIGISKNTGTTSNIVFSSDFYNPNTTHLIVVKYEAVEGESNDIVKLFINPDLSKSESANSFVVSTDVATDLRAFAFGLRQRESAADIAGIRIADSWNEVLGLASEILSVESTTPSENAFVDATVTTSASIEFNKAVTKGTGVITLSAVGNENITISLDECSINNNIVRIPLTLQDACNYTITAPAGAFECGSLKSTETVFAFSTKENNSNLYLQEYFSYKTDSDILGLNSWVVPVNGVAGTISPKIGNKLLAYSGYAASNKGNTLELDSMVQNAIEGRIGRINVPYTTASVPVNDAVYSAFMIRLDNTRSTSGKEIFNYMRNDGSGTSRGRVAYKIEEGEVFFGISKSGASSSITEWSSGASKDDTHLLVVKYVNGSTSTSGDNDNFFLFVNPDLSKDETENDGVKLAAFGNNEGGGANLQSITLTNSSINATIGALRIAKTWADAVPYNPALGLKNVNNLSSKIFTVGRQLHYTGEKTATATLYNVSGQQIMSRTMQPNEAITLNQASGVYIVKLQDIQGQIQSSKIVIK